MIFLSLIPDGAEAVFCVLGKMMSMPYPRLLYQKNVFVLFLNGLWQCMTIIFIKTDQYILNKDGYFLTFDRYYETFALRKTYLGTECDIHALKDIRSSAENLASFHNHCLAISFSSENLRKYTSISTYYEQKYLELKSIARYIRKRKKKGIFEYLFLEQTKAFWEQMERSIQILNETTPSRCGWCHGAYNHHNIIMTSSAPATIHFEHFYHGYPILDVYYFLKKALEKNNYNFCLL